MIRSSSKPLATIAVLLFAALGGQAQAATPDATVTVQVTQTGAGCLHNCSVSQTSNGYGAGYDEQITAASDTLTYTPTVGQAGTGSASAVADPVQGYVGARATGGTDYSTTTIGRAPHALTFNTPGVLTSTASASINGTITLAPLSSATDVRVNFSLGGILTGNFLNQSSVTSTLTIWVNNPNGGTSCGLFSSNCYSFNFIETANGLGIRPLTLASQDWLDTTVVTLAPSAGDGYATGFAFSGVLVLPVGLADTLTFYDAISVSASGNAMADFLDPQNLGLQDPPPIVNQTNGFLVPEPASLAVFGFGMTMMAALRRRRQNRRG